jgi:hypothetical protein
MKQFRAHLQKTKTTIRRQRDKCQGGPVFLRAHARAGHFEEAVRAVVAADFDGDAAIAADGVAFLAEEELVERMEGVRGGRHAGRWRDWVGG